MINILDIQKQKFNIVGRHTWQGDILYLGYSASYLEFKFKGSKVDISLVTDLIKDQKGNEDVYHAWLAVFINDNDDPVKRIELCNKQETFTIYESEWEEEVTVRLMKYSEAAFSKLGIRAISIEGEVLLPPHRKARRIEFIGDSITCGYGVESSSELDLFQTKDENPMLAYPCQTAKLLDAEFQLVSWSGIGIITNFIHESVNEPLVKPWLMPDLYEYSDGELERLLGKSKYQVWDNSIYVPDLVIIYLGTNDASYTRGIKERQEEFAIRYKRFLEKVRSKNPDSYILCILGSMNQELCEVEEKQVLAKQEEGDRKIKYLKLPLQDEKDGLGTDAHPSPITHRKVAEQIAKAIKVWINW